MLLIEVLDFRALILKRVPTGRALHLVLRVGVHVVASHTGFVEGLGQMPLTVHTNRCHPESWVCHQIVKIQFFPLSLLSRLSLFLVYSKC